MDFFGGNGGKGGGVGWFSVCRVFLDEWIVILLMFWCDKITRRECRFMGVGPIPGNEYRI